MLKKCNTRRSTVVILEPYCPTGTVLHNIASMPNQLTVWKREVAQVSGEGFKVLFLFSRGTGAGFQSIYRSYTDEHLKLLHKKSMYIVYI